MAASLATAAEEAAPFLARAADGPGLGSLETALIGYGTAMCATSLDVEEGRKHARDALDRGADEELLIEVLMLVSAVGVHALHEGVIALEAASPTDGTAAAAEVRKRKEGSSVYWELLDAELPGFLGGLAARAPWAYEAFIDFAGAGARHGRLDPLDRELIWAAIDATPTHRYLPGLRLHLANSVRLGATRRQLVETLEIAAAAPLHGGTAPHRA